LRRHGRGSLLGYVDVFNLLNRENAQAADYSVSLYEGRVAREIHPQLEIMPSFGVRWVF